MKKVTLLGAIFLIGVISFTYGQSTTTGGMDDLFVVTTGSSGDTHSHGSTGQPVMMANIRRETAGPMRSMSHRSVASLGRQPAVSVDPGDSRVILSELARSLRYDPVLIYEYVYSRIDRQLYYGSRKGAVGAYWEKSANDLDQALLIEALLEASAPHNPDIVSWSVETYDIVYPTALSSELFFFSGPDADVSAAVEGMFDGFGRRYWAGLRDYSGWGELIDRDDTMTIPRFILVAQLYPDADSPSGSTYYLDAFLAPSTRRWHLDVAAVSGYERESFLDAVFGSGSRGDWVARGASSEAVNTKISEYTANVVSEIRNDETLANASVAEVFGFYGQDNVAVFDRNSLPKQPPSALAAANYPSRDLSSSVLFQFWRRDATGPDFEVRIDTRDLVARRVTLTFDGSGRARLKIDGTTIASGNPTSAGETCDLVANIDHVEDPDVTSESRDHPFTYSVVSGSTYAIVSDYGGSSDDIVADRNRRVAESIRSGIGDDEEPVLGETLNSIGLTYFRQLNMVRDILGDPSSELGWVVYHGLGLVAQEDGYYISVGQRLLDHRRQDDTVAPRIAYHTANGIVGSILEESVLRQVIDPEIPGVSSTGILGEVIKRGQDVFVLNSENFDAAKSSLVNYSEDELSEIELALSGDSVRVLPRDRDFSLNDWYGTGWFHVSPDLMDLKIQGDIGEASGREFGGGYASQASQVQPSYTFNQVLASTNTGGSSSSGSGGSFGDSGGTPTTGADPIDMKTGAFYLNPVDVSLGELMFRRSYNSGRQYSESVVGWGWSHQYVEEAKRYSDPALSLGSRLPVDAAASYVVGMILSDLLASESVSTIPAENWVSATLVGDWLGEYLVGNAVQVTRGSDSQTYVQLPDGSFSASYAGTSELVEGLDGRFSLLGRFGGTAQYRSDGKIEYHEDVHGNRVSFQYNGDLLDRVTDSVGRYLDFGYSTVGDNLVRLRSITDSGSTSHPDGRSVTFGYDDEGDLVWSEDFMGRRTRYVYDDHLMIQHFLPPVDGYPDGYELTNQYDGRGRVMWQSLPRQSGRLEYELYVSEHRASEVREDGREQTWVFDQLGREVFRSNSYGASEMLAYNGQGLVTATRDAEGNVVSYEYDRNFNRVRTVPPVGAAEIIEYNEALLPRLSYLEGLRNEAVEFGYNDRHQLIYERDEIGRISERGYYHHGMMEWSRDPNNVYTYYTYDQFRNPDTTTVAEFAPTDVDLDAIGLLRSFTDRAGATRSREYYPDGGTRWEDDPLGKRTEILIDDLGRATSVTDRNDQTTTVTFTPSNRVASTTLHDGTVITKTYDDLDRLVEAENPQGIVARDYDLQDRLIWSRGVHGVEIQYEYNRLNEVTRITYPQGRSIRYDYDSNGRIDLVTLEWLSKTMDFVYDDARQELDYVVNFNGTVTDFEEDAAGQQVAVSTTRSDGSTVASHRVTEFYPGGNPRTMTLNYPAPFQLSNASMIYGYNTERNRLESSDGESFAYDDSGQASGISGARDLSFEFDPAHRLRAYGANSYQYDGEGRRVVAVRDGITSRYVFHGDSKIVAEVDDGGAISRYYVYAPGLAAMIDSETGSVYSYHYDYTGNTVAITNDDQEIVNSYSYTPYGELLHAATEIDQPFTFSGVHAVTTESHGLYYMTNRYYDSIVGRFVSEDPLNIDGGINLYEYARSNPITFVDPSGLDPTAGGQAFHAEGRIGIGNVAVMGYVEKSDSGTWTIRAGVGAGVGAYGRVNVAGKLNLEAGAMTFAGVGQEWQTGPDSLMHSTDPLFFEAGGGLGYTRKVAGDAGPYVSVGGGGYFRGSPIRRRMGQDTYSIVVVGGGLEAGVGTKTYVDIGHIEVFVDGERAVGIERVGAFGAIHD
jgi:RHS repeat-associated protein